MSSQPVSLSKYFSELLPGEQRVLAAILPGLLLAILAGINFWGIRHSSRANIACTVIEVSGLLFVIVAGFIFMLGNESPAPPVDEESSGEWALTLQASALAFFAFIGFEDMVNIAEETKEPRRTLPIAILTAIVFAGVIYMIVIWVATSVVSSQTLGASDAPLLEVVKRAVPNFPAAIFVVVALFAVANTALLNFITASRLLYGMAGQKLVPGWLGSVHHGTRTPARAIGVIFAAAVILAWSGTLPFLAGTTSTLLLLIFLGVNLSLVRVKQQEKVSGEQKKAFRIPIFVPWLASAICLGLIAFVPGESLWRALAIVLMGVALVVARGIRAKRAEPGA